MRQEGEVPARQLPRPGRGGRRGTELSGQQTTGLAGLAATASGQLPAWVAPAQGERADVDASDEVQRWGPAVRSPYYDLKLIDRARFKAVARMVTEAASAMVVTGEVAQGRGLGSVWLCVNGMVRREIGTRQNEFVLRQFRD